ncbi:MAG TPA: ATP-binding protein [Albitalea sp.]|uniref:ATP-binding protein n=1 Tax=Piscinibacter sp. TaxID=1903157 RepID=UPI002ED141DC
MSVIRRLLQRPRERRLGMRLLAAMVLAGTGMALAATAVLLVPDHRREVALVILAAATLGALVAALFILALARRWVARHDEMTRALSDELGRRAAIDADRARLVGAFERNRALLQAIFDNSAAVITVKALDGRYLLVNKRWTQRHQRAPEAFIGKTDHELFPPEVAQALRRTDQHVIATGAALQAEETLMLDDGERTVLSSKAPLFNDKGEVYAVCGIHTDITDRKHAEQELRHYRERLEVLVDERTAALRRANEDLTLTNQRLEQAQTQLVQSEKMASIGVLAAGVAHEINNPIGFVSSNLGTLLQYVRGLLQIVAAYEAAEDTIAPQRLSAIARLKQGVDLAYLREDVGDLGRETQEGLARVTKIVQDLKDFAHAGESQWQSCSLHRGLDSTLNIAWNELKYKVEVVKRYGELPDIECLPSELNQVFMNLFVNAAQAIATRGELRIITGVDGDSVWVEVADNGSGIAPEHLQRIFEPFFTTKPVGQGTGLGLALSYSIVKKHGGTLEVASTLGVGTTFRVRLPISQQMEAALP